jgi:hypothetical protein
MFGGSHYYGLLDTSTGRHSWAPESRKTNSVVHRRNSPLCSLHAAHSFVIRFPEKKGGQPFFITFPSSLQHTYLRVLIWRVFLFFSVPFFLPVFFLYLGL